MANESNERSLDKKEKIEILDLYKESGLSKVEFANEYGLNYKSFCNWSRLLEKGESEIVCGRPVFMEVDTYTRERHISSKVDISLHYGKDIKLEIKGSPEVTCLSSLIVQLSSDQ